MNYYGNVNPDLLAKIPVTAKHVLEVGCGSARLGEAFKARSPDSKYYGIELFESAAKDAAKVYPNFKAALAALHPNRPKQSLAKDQITFKKLYASFKKA